MVYGRHMFLSGMNPFTALVFSFPTLVITIPATIIVLIWIGSLYGSKLRINPASLFALGFISMFVSGGGGCRLLAPPSIGIYRPATYLVGGPIPNVLGGVASFWVFAAENFCF